MTPLRVWPLVWLRSPSCVRADPRSTRITATPTIPLPCSWLDYKEGNRVCGIHLSPYRSPPFSFFLSPARFLAVPPPLASQSLRRRRFRRAVLLFLPALRGFDSVAGESSLAVLPCSFPRFICSVFVLGRRFLRFFAIVSAQSSDGALQL
jgi:hypothetical protein